MRTHSSQPVLFGVTLATRSSVCRSRSSVREAESVSGEQDECGDDGEHHDAAPRRARHGLPTHRPGAELRRSSAPGGGEVHRIAVERVSRLTFAQTCGNAVKLRREVLGVSRRERRTAERFLRSPTSAVVRDCLCLKSSGRTEGLLDGYVGLGTIHHQCLAAPCDHEGFEGRSSPSTGDCVALPLCGSGEGGWPGSASSSGWGQPRWASGC